MNEKDYVGFTIAFLCFWAVGVIKAYHTGKIIFFVAMIALPPVSVIYGFISTIAMFFGR